MSIFGHYYQTELAYYRELAREFARAFPEVAHMVGERGSDTSVERLLQGAALLSSRLRYRVEDDFPDVVHPLFEILWPQYLRPLPATTLLCFTARADTLRQSQAIESGTLVKALAVEGRSSDSVECAFRTSSEIVLHPIDLVSAEMNRSHPADIQLRLRFAMTGGASLRNVKIRRVRIQLVGDDVTRFTLYFWLAHHVSKVSVNDYQGTTHLRLPASAVTAAGFGDGDALYPHLPPPRSGLRIIREYFAFIDKFLAVDVCGLEQASAEELDAGFDLCFHLGRPPDESMKVGRSNFALGCGPAYNISESEQVDLPVKEATAVFRLEPPRQGDVFDVERVGNYDLETGEWVEYEPFFSPRRSRLLDDQPCYQILRRADGVEGLETYLAITDPAGRPLQPRTDLIYAWLTQTDGDLPLRLGLGDVRVPTSSSPEFAEFKNIVPVSPPEPVAIGDDRQWRLLAQFTMHPDDLASVNGLRQLVRASRGARATLGGEPEIQRAEYRMAMLLHKRTMVPVRKIEVALGEESFICMGHLYLFASVLSAICGKPLDSNVFNQLTVVAEPSGTAFEFPPS